MSVWYWYIFLFSQVLALHGMKTLDKSILDPYALQYDVQAAKRLELLAQEDDVESRLFIRQLCIRTNSHILALGCGTASMELWMAKNIVPNGLVCAIDKNVTFLDIARKNAVNQAINNISFVCCDVYDMPTDKQYDVVYARYLLQHVQDPKKVIAAMCAVLTNGGQLVIEDENFYETRFEPAHCIIDDIMNMARDVARIQKTDYGIGPKLPSLIQEQQCMIIKMCKVLSSKSGIHGIELLSKTVEEVAKKLEARNLLKKDSIAHIIETLGNISKNNEREIITQNYKICAERM